MSLGLKPYPAYKDSGTDWLGDVPEHWSVSPNRALFTEVKERDCPDEPMLSVTITQGVIPQRSLLSDSSKKDGSNEDKSSYKLVHPGDIAYNKMRAWQGAIGASGYRGIVSPAYIVQRLRADHSCHFYHYLFRTPSFAKEAERWSYGITSDMWSLRPEHFKLIRSCAPPVEEQTAIVRFLDYIDRRIARYIRAKQKLIKLLGEQKQVTIHQAVTGQIDVRTGKPYPAYKESGFEWLARVPEHWKVQRLGAIGRLFKGNGGTKEDEAATGVPCLRYGDIYMHHRFFVREARSCVSVERASDYTPIHYGDVLFAGSGETIDEIGKSVVCLIESPACCGGDVILFRPSIEVDAPFMGYAADSTQTVFQKSCMGRGITVMHVYGDQLKNLWLTLPPKPEQVGISHYLNEAMANIDATIERTSRGIDLLREYRVRLIADVVTGKVDVREAAANLPDEGEELEPLADEDLLTDESEVEESVEIEAALEEVEA
jgi:type I restriction enzyme S subunit